jgi:hypothetical protein
MLEAGCHMTDADPPPLTVVQPGEGLRGELGSIGVHFKLWGHDTDGEIGFRSGDREVVLGVGGYITKPRGELHAMWNAGDVPARMIEIISPAGFEHFFHEVSELIAHGAPTAEQGAELTRRYGLQFGEPDWLPDVIARYGLSAR